MTLSPISIAATVAAAVLAVISIRSLVYALRCVRLTPNLALGPLGFRTGMLVGWLLTILGAAQALTAFSQPARVPALLLATLLIAGGATLLHLAAWNEQRGRSPFAAPVQSSGEVVWKWRLPTLQGGLGSAAVLSGVLVTVPLVEGTGWLSAIGHVLRTMTLYDTTHWANPAPGAHALLDTASALLGGSLLIGLGVIAVVVIVAGAWLWLATWAESGGAASTIAARRKVAAALATLCEQTLFVPYLIPALVVRALYCTPTQWQTAGAWLESTVDEKQAFAAGRAQALGFLVAVVVLGLQEASGFIGWLSQRWEADRALDSTQVARVAGRSPTLLLLRDSLWLRHRRQLSGLLLSAGLSAIVIEILHTALLDAFRPPGFPLYPSLGATLFVLRDVQGASMTGGWVLLHSLLHGLPLGLDGQLTLVYELVVVAAACVLVGVALPAARTRFRLKGDTLEVDGRPLLEHTGLERESNGRLKTKLLLGPPVIWVLGPSGSGKSSFLRALADAEPTAVHAEQDPDRVLPPSLSPADLLWLLGPRWDSVRLILTQLSDDRMDLSGNDAYTTLGHFSRGERQRLVFAVARAAVRNEALLLLDEFTSAQDAQRAQPMWEFIASPSGLGDAQLSRNPVVMLATHDPLRLRTVVDGERAGDELWWLGQSVHRCEIRPGDIHEWGWESGTPPEVIEAANDFFLGVETIDDPPPSRVGTPASRVAALPPAADIALLGTEPIRMGTRTLQPTGHLRFNDLRGRVTLLEGASGTGKSTLVKQLMAEWLGRPQLRSQLAMGYVPQDPGRAFPGDLPVHEALGGIIASKEARQAFEAEFGTDFGPGKYEQSVEMLSEGQRQRLLLLRELMRLSREQARGKLVILDEPFASIDPAAHVEFARRVARWVAADPVRHAALVITHMPDEDAALMDREMLRVGWNERVARRRIVLRSRSGAVPGRSPG